ncbi:MAG: tyrosine-protein phosphatase [Anaerolineae bacterium]
MTTLSLQPGQSLSIPSVPNLRDMGGWPTPDGPVTRGVLFRSAEFSDLAGDDLAAFDKLGITTVYDFRTEAERGVQPNLVPDHIQYVTLDILKDSSSQGPALLLKVMGDPKAAEEALGGGKALQMFEHAYRELVNLPSARTGYQRFFTDLADGRHTPALFHCTTGKDRTGWAAAATLMLLGVSDDDVMTDYLLTNDQLAPAVKPIIDRFVAIGGDAELLEPVLGVRAEYLAVAIAEMRAQYGDIEGYFTNGLSLERSTIATLRSILTVPSPG